MLFELGRGGMGTVFLARMAGVAGFERLVVVKRMNRDLLSKPVLVKRFVNEAKIASHVHHANVVGVQIIGEDMDGYFLVLDYVEGDSLDSLLVAAAQRRERIPVPILLRVVLDGLAGLHAIHEARDPDDQPLGILHRDVSTCNLLVGADGVTRITDFGVAKSAQDAGLTGDLLVGKVLYMAPEYLLQRPVDRRLDVYAMGMLLWLSLADSDPWGEEMSVAQIMSKAVTEGVPRLPASCAPSEIADVIERACAREPAARFETARAMSSALTKAAAKSLETADAVDVSALVQHLAGERLQRRRRAAARSGARATPPEIDSSLGPDAGPRSHIGGDAPRSRGGAAMSSKASEGADGPASSREGPVVTPVSRRGTVVTPVSRGAPAALPRRESPHEEPRASGTVVMFAPPRASASAVARVEAPRPSPHAETAPVSSATESAREPESIEDPPQTAQPLTASIRVPGLESRFPRGLVIGVAALLLVGVIGGGWALRAGSTSPPPAPAVAQAPSASAEVAAASVAPPPVASSAFASPPPVRGKSGKPTTVKPPLSPPPSPGGTPGTISTGNPYR